MWSRGCAAEVAQLRWHSSDGTAGTWLMGAAGSAWLDKPPAPGVSPWDTGNKKSVGMSGLSCVRSTEEEAVSLRILEEQRCAEMMAEWLLQVVFGFCKCFFPFPFCFSVSFGSRGLTFHFQNRHLIKLAAFWIFFA